MHGIPALRLQTPPIGRNGGNDHLIPRFQILDQLSDLDDLSHGFVAENHVAAVAYRALPDGMHVRRAGRYRQRADNGVQGAALGHFLFYPARFSDAEHCVTFHFHIDFSSSKQIRCLYPITSEKENQRAFCAFLSGFAKNRSRFCPLFNARLYSFSENPRRKKQPVFPSVSPQACAAKKTTRALIVFSKRAVKTKRSPL